MGADQTTLFPLEKMERQQFFLLLLLGEGWAEGLFFRIGGVSPPSPAETQYLFP
ncbi:MAG: hypothetical protein OEZ36_09170 [Spirochaetota bacterium]|nr:hypothetical protein [Spirochaetota bacterium]